MATKKLRQLKKIELLELLVASERQNEELRKQMVELEEELEERELKINQAGSLADACLHVNQVFETTQAAADQYLENVKKLNSGQSEDAEYVLQNAKEQAEQILAEAQQKCAEMEAEAQQKVEEKWQTIRERLEELYEAHIGLRELIALSKLNNLALR